jgi:hypothetical protein
MASVIGNAISTPWVGHSPHEQDAIRAKIADHEHEGMIRSKNTGGNIQRGEKKRKRKGDILLCLSKVEQKSPWCRRQDLNLHCQ